MKMLQLMFSAFLRTYPAIKLELSLYNDASTFSGDDKHALIRIGLQRDSSVIARKLKTVKDILVASPDYLASVAPITDASQLENYKLLKG